MENNSPDQTASEGVLKKKIEDFRKNPSVKTIFILVLFFIIVYFTVQQSLTVVQLRYQMSNLTEQATDYKNQTKILTEKIEQITTDQYIEEEAKTRLGMVKSGEVPIKIIENKTDAAAPKQTLQPKDKISIYMKDWYESVAKWVEKLHKK